MARPRSVPVEVQDDVPLDADVLAEDAFEELFDGLPQEQREIRLDGRIDGLPYATPTTTNFGEIPEGRVVLTNLRFPAEVLFIPERVVDERGERKVFSGRRMVEFIDTGIGAGRVIVDDEVADTIIAMSPYIKREPKEGEVFSYRETGFETRDQSIYNEYVNRYVQNR